MKVTKVDVCLKYPVKPRGMIETIRRVGSDEAHITILGDPLIDGDILLFTKTIPQPGQPITFTRRAFTVHHARNAKGVTTAFMESAGTYPWYWRLWWEVVGWPRVELPEKGSTALVIANKRFDHRGVEVEIHD